MNNLNVFIKYNGIKLSVYIIGFCLSIFSIAKFGLVDSHTPPIGFVIPVFFIFIGSIWSLIDWIISYFSKSSKINFTSHYIGIGMNFIIVISILFLS